ncbi:hypothetical protein [Azospirillum canadense]|nr:hypothetical protein [Azospirillum canadense]MCW2236129.1 hypothetical protein [Azospirillum canadense]
METAGGIGHPPFSKEVFSEGGLGMNKMPFLLILRYRRWRLEIRLTQI